MDLISRLGSSLFVVSLGLSTVACGGKAHSGGGADSGDLGNALPANTGSGRVPASTDRFAFAKSGERVLALGYESEGVSQFRTLHDQQLGFDCELMNGKICGDLHCVPKRSARPELIFLDANCSQPATWILFQQGAGVGEWVTFERELSECPGQVFVPETFEIAEEIYPESSGGPLPPVYEWKGTSCAPAYPPAKSIPAVNRLIPHADSELAAAKAVSLDVGGGLWLSRVIGEDGSELTVGVTNAAGEACTVQSNGECVPKAAEGRGPFPMTQRIRQGAGAMHVDLFISSPGAARTGVPVARFPQALDFIDDDGNRCQVVPAVDGTLRCATLSPDVHSAETYRSPYWKDAACMEPLFAGYPTDGDLASLRFGEYTDSGALIAVSTVQAYYGPVFTMRGHCIPAVYDDSSGVLVTLDRRTDALTMPLVSETTL